MIIDTIYLLPLSRIKVRTDLLRAIAEGRVEGIGFADLKVSLISLFELQAKASKLGIPPSNVSKAIDAVLRAFPVIPFYRSDVVEEAHRLRELLGDYIDGVILATAIVLEEDLATEDTQILSLRDTIEKHYGVKVLSYKDLVKR